MSVAAYLCKKARERAVAKGEPFDLVPDDIYVPEVCPILNIAMQRHHGRMQGNSYSLDKVIPELSYRRGNVRVISWRANKLKGDARLIEVQAIANYIKEHCERSEFSEFSQFSNDGDVNLRPHDNGTEVLAHETGRHEGNVGGDSPACC
jgi:hypothetical protein